MVCAGTYECSRTPFPSKSGFTRFVATNADLIYLRYVEREILRNRYACRYNITLEYLDRPKTSLKTLKVITDKGIPITKYEHLLANWLDALEFKRKM